MPDNISKTQRLLDLIAYLAGRRTPATVEEIMESVPAYDIEVWREGTDTEKQSLRRKFERDKDDLRGAGIPLESVTYSMHGFEGQEIEGYQLRRRDFYMPYLKLVEREPRPTGKLSTEVEWTEDELEVALGSVRLAENIPGYPLRAEARSAFRKLAFGLDLEAFSHPGALHATPAERAGDAATVSLLVEACSLRKRVTMRYHSIGRDETSERTLDPCGVFLQYGQWYLVGWCHQREELRLFRVSRMSEVRRNRKREKTPDFQVPEDFRLSDYTDRDPWELGDADREPQTARVRFDFPRSLWAESNELGERTEAHDDGSATHEFGVRNPDPFVRWVLSMAPEARITGPEELVQRQRAMAETIVRRHTGDAEADDG